MEQGEEGSGQNFSPSPGQGAKANRRKGCREERRWMLLGLPYWPLPQSPKPGSAPPPHPTPQARASPPPFSVILSMKQQSSEPRWPGLINGNKDTHCRRAS